MLLGKWPISVTFWACCLFGGIPDLMSQPTWRRTYGGLGADNCKAVVRTTDAGFLFCGSTGSFGDGGDTYVVKVDEQGSIQWSLPFGGSGVQTGAACVEDAEGFVIAGTTSSGSMGGYDMCLARVNSSGMLAWQSHVGTSEWDFCNDMKALGDGFVLVGTSYGTGEPAGDAWIVRTDGTGATLWTQRIGGEGFDEAHAVHVDANENIIVVGAMDVDSPTEDAFVARLTNSGSLDWMQRFGGDSADVGLGVAGSSTGGYVVMGATRSYSTVPQVVIRKVDDTGAFVWQREYGTVGETRMARIVSRDGGFALAGFNTAFNAGGKDMFLILLDEEGNWLLGKNYGGLNDEVGTCLQALDDGGYIVAGSTEDYGPGIEAIYAVRVGADAETEDDTVYPTLDPVGVEGPSNSGPLVVLSPNPSSGGFEVRGSSETSSIRLYDTTGREVDRIFRTPGSELFVSNLPAGTYTAIIEQPDRSFKYGQIVILR